MTRLADSVDGVIGVDTHRDTLAAAVADRVGGTLAQTSAAADLDGYQELLGFARAQLPGRAAGRSRAPAATAPGGSLPVGPRRAGGRGWSAQAAAAAHRAKSDALDALRAAREALAHDHPLAPRRRGDREALRVLIASRHNASAARVSATNQLKALIVSAPEELRAELRGLGSNRQITRCAGLRDRPSRSLEHRMTVRALRSTAQRIRLLAAEAAGRRAELERLVAAVAPWLLELPGAGPISAAQVLGSWSYASRLRDDPETRVYASRRRAESKSARDVRRCLKRVVARQLFKLLERHDRPAVQVLRA
jgi:transposase